MQAYNLHALASVLRPRLQHLSALYALQSARFILQWPVGPFKLQRAVVYMLERQCSFSVECSPFCRP